MPSKDTVIGNPKIGTRIAPTETVECIRQKTSAVAVSAWSLFAMNSGNSPVPAPPWSGVSPAESGWWAR